MGEYRDIQIDFDVHRRIELERQSFSETPNTVLRRLLKIDNDQSAQTAPVASAGRPWAGKGVMLPHGTELLMEYNGRTHSGIIENGVWIVEGRQFASPSAAAGGVAITKSGSRTSLDGWIYWRVKRPNDVTWLRLSDLRSQNATPEMASRDEQENSQPSSHLENDGSDLPAENKVVSAHFGVGDTSFINACRGEQLPETVVHLAQKFLENVRKFSNDTLREGQNRKWVTNPRNFLAITIQNRNQQFCIHVKKTPTLEGLAGDLDIRDDRPGYVRFWLQNFSQLGAAVRAAKASFDL